MKAFNGVRRKDIHWSHKPVAQDTFPGKKVAIVGGTNGIGRAIALELANSGANVLVVGRTFRDKGVAGLVFVQADLTLMKEASRVAQQLPAESLDMLIFTNGIMAGSERRQTPEGIELDLAVSYLNRFVMVREMAPSLGMKRRDSAAKPRVFVWGFPGTNQKGNSDDFNSDRSYSLMAAHSNTVIGNEALVLDSVARYPDVNFFGMNPGLMKSSIRSNTLGEGSLGLKLTEMLIGALFPSVEAYGKSIVPLLVSPDIETYSGAMFNRHGDPILASESLVNGASLGNIIERSEQLVSRALG